MSDKLVVRDKFNGRELQDLAYLGSTQIEHLLTKAEQAAVESQHLSAFDRSRLLSTVADMLNEELESWATLICQEAGKPITLARTEVERACHVFQWAAAEALRFAPKALRLDTTRSQRAGVGLVTRFPRGVIAAITPFNFPLNLAAHKVAPALATGNVVLLKPSPQAPLVAKRLAELITSLCKAQGLPTELVQLALVENNAVLPLCQDPRVAMVSFTGSSAVGWWLRDHLPRKPVTLELGGNAWCIIAEDIAPAQLPQIAERIVGGAYGYAGQSCISVQNIACHRSLFKDFTAVLSQKVSQCAYGDPKAANVVCGPVISTDAAKRIRAIIQDATNGASSSAVPSVVSTNLIHGDSGRKSANESGALIAPTLILAPNPSSPLVQEEIFGPVASALAYESTDDLFTLINGGRYGLQAGLFTDSQSLIEKAYHTLKLGGLVVNNTPSTRYDHQPYGGIKDSGYGREGIEAAMDELTEPRFLALSTL
jgi:glyceraldehyde-3-phosphate dehydrogenase (NADP+)